MGKNIEFKLKNIRNTKKLNKQGVKETIEVFQYHSQYHDAVLTVKGRFEATNLGLPTNDLNDMVLVEIGAKNTQKRLVDDLHDVGKKPIDKKPSTTISAKDRKLLRDHVPTKGELKDAPRLRGRPKK